MEAQYAYWIVTFAVGLMVAALAWFIKRLVAEAKGFTVDRAVIEAEVRKMQSLGGAILEDGAK